MQFFAGKPNQVGQTRFYIHMHIFLFDRPDELSSLNLSLNLRQAMLNITKLLFGQDTNFGKHRRMRQRTLNILKRHTLIKGYRCSKFFNKGIGGFRKTGTRQFFGINSGHSKLADEKVLIIPLLFLSAAINPVNYGFR